VVVKAGRFGEYVTDGKVNASLQQGDSVERIDIMRASELLMIRRQKIEHDPPKPARKSGGRGASATSGAAKKAGTAAGAKKSARKGSPRKAAAKKAGTKKAASKKAGS
jgi:DNA topoisomerase-1